MCLDPDLVPIFVHQAKTARATLSGSENRNSFSSRTLTVVRMNNREPKTWRCKPFFRAIAEHLLDITADKVNSALARAGFSPRFPNDTGHMLDEVFDATATKLELRSEFRLVDLSGSPFRHNRGHEERHQ